MFPAIAMCFGFLDFAICLKIARYKPACQAARYKAEMNPDSFCYSNIFIKLDIYSSSAKNLHQINPILC